jgi:hypothetical protein
VHLRRGALAVVLICLIAIVTAAPVAAVEKTKFKGFQAEAVFDPFEDCVEWLVDITPMREKGRTSLFLVASAYDFCFDEQIMTAGGTMAVPAGDFEIDEALGWARLDTNLRVPDSATGGFANVSIDLEWTADGTPANVIKFHDVINEPGFHLVQKIHLVERSASTSGTITVDGHTLSLDSPLIADVAAIKAKSLLVVR